jgi:hypothetical protein
VDIGQIDNSQNDGEQSPVMWGIGHNPDKKEVEKLKTESIDALSRKIADETKSEYYQEARRSILVKDKDIDRWNKWVECIYSGISTKVIPGPKYTKIDICTPQQSGRYMVVNDTGDIYGIKAYGVIHKGHYYGTLDTVDQYYWGSYRAIKRA